MASLDGVSLFTSKPFDLVNKVINDIWPTPRKAIEFMAEEIIELVQFDNKLFCL